MTTQTVRFIVNSVVGMAVLAIIIVIGFCVRGCLIEESRKEAIREAQVAAYEARFPNNGDKIELDGKEVVIIKKYFFGPRKYQVRLPDGRMTDVVGSEIIDKKPIERKSDED
jgi:hypothetical protein